MVAALSFPDLQLSQTRNSMRLADRELALLDESLGSLLERLEVWVSSERPTPMPFDAAVRALRDVTMIRRKVEEFDEMFVDPGMRAWILATRPTVFERIAALRTIATVGGSVVERQATAGRTAEELEQLEDADDAAAIAETRDEPTRPLSEVRRELGL